MEIKKKENGNEVQMALCGRLDTTTSPDLEAEVSALSDSVTSLVFDCAELEYISSAGLRVLLGAQKKMMKAGFMKLIHVNEDVMDVFEITGFSDILTIE